MRFIRDYTFSSRLKSLGLAADQSPSYEGPIDKELFLHILSVDVNSVSL